MVCLITSKVLVVVKGGYVGPCWVCRFTKCGWLVTLDGCVGQLIYPDWWACMH